MLLSTSNIETIPDHGPLAISDISYVLQALTSSAILSRTVFSSSLVRFPVFLHLFQPQQNLISPLVIVTQIRSDFGADVTQVPIIALICICLDGIHCRTCLVKPGAQGLDLGFEIENLFGDAESVCYANPK